MTCRPSLLLIGLCLATPPALSNEPLPTPPPTGGALASSPMPRTMDRAALEKAIAGTVVAALSERFGGRAIEARFDDLQEQSIDGRQRAIRGEGGMRFAGETGWIGFRFASRYDEFLGQAGWPELEIGVGGDGRLIPNDSVALRQLEDRMAALLQDEVGTTTVRMQLDRVDTTEMAGHYLGMEARGLADFGLDGSSEVRIHALYDRRDGAWLQLDYQLGPEAAQTASLAPSP